MTWSRAALGVIALAVWTIGLSMFVIFAVMTPERHVDLIEPLTDYVLVLLHISAIAQTTFTVVWLTREWWTTWIARALLMKSLALTIYLDYAVIAYHTGHYTEEAAVSAVLFTVLVITIVVQPVVLIYETYIRGRSRR
jgi:hypothetical protein